MQNKGFFWGFGVAIIGIAIAWLLGIVSKQEQAQIDALAELHSKELTACLEQAGAGTTCKIEYLRDKTDTVYGARVVKEAI